MTARKRILAICGSASRGSANLAILHLLAELGTSTLEFTILDDLAVLPHFRTELTDENTPPQIVELRNAIENAHGVIISTPEYVFSIPSGLKNVIEWCVATTVFSDKPLGMVTAAASGEKGHQELQLIMKTVQATFTDDTALLIQGVKGKFSADGECSHAATKASLIRFIQAFTELVARGDQPPTEAVLASPHDATSTHS